MSRVSAEYIQALIDGRDPCSSPPTDPPWNEVVAHLQEIPISDRHQELIRWVSQSNGDGNEVMNALIALRSRRECEPTSGRIWTVSGLLEQDLGELPVIVGEPRNALIVRGEIHLLAGPTGVGKSLVCFDMALRLASGRGVFGYPIGTDRPLRVLIFQAELPLQFVRARLDRMVRWADLQDAGGVSDAFHRIFIYEFTGSLFIDDENGRAEIGRLARELAPDLIFIDPFLSFFGGDSENDNPGIRKALDALKREVAQQFACAIIITDHLTKGDSREGPKARGAGAKTDVSALVINISRTKAPECEEGAKFINLHINKMRYGWEPADPILLRLDPQSLRHQVWDSGLEEMFDVVRRILTDAGGEIRTQGEILRRLNEASSIGRRRSGRVLARALRSGLIMESIGSRNSKIYRLSEAGVACGQSDGSDE